MARSKGSNANMRFLFGSVFFFFVVIITIMLFSYFTLQQWSKPGMATADTYAISFSKQFDGLRYDLYLNDSLLYVGDPVCADTVIRVARMADENALLVVEKENDLVSVVEIGKKGRILVSFDRNGEVFADIIEQ